MRFVWIVGYVIYMGIFDASAKLPMHKNTQTQVKKSNENHGQKPSSLHSN